MPWAHFIGDTGWYAAVPPTRSGGDLKAHSKVTTVALPLRVGARTLGTLRRRLVRRPFSLTEVLSTRLPVFGPLPAEAEGYLVTSLPLGLVEKLRAAFPELAAFVRQTYRRSYASLDESHDQWLAAMSSKGRSNLRRKLRRFADQSGGQLDIRCYRRPGEMAIFHRHARYISRLTYQERLLNCGIPDGGDFLERLESRAIQGSVLGWILFLDDQPVSYLHAPAEDGVLIYDHLGYDPQYASLSPGTVLQAQVMKQLFDEKSFHLFDFTEGEGRHKDFFSTGHVECVDLLLLRRSASNLVAGRLLGAFDRLVERARNMAHGLGLQGLARRVKR